MTFTPVITDNLCWTSWPNRELFAFANVMLVHNASWHIWYIKSGIYFFVLWCWQHCSYFFYWIILLIVYFIISSNFTIIRLIVLMQLTILIDFFLTIVPNETECFIIFWKNNMLIHCFFKNCKTFCLTCDND